MFNMHDILGVDCTLISFEPCHCSLDVVWKIGHSKGYDFDPDTVTNCKIEDSRKKISVRMNRGRE
jgi:hypothetical protein